MMPHFTVNMTNYSEGITKKLFQRQLTVLPHNKTYSPIRIWKKYISYSSSGETCFWQMSC